MNNITTNTDPFTMEQAMEFQRIDLKRWQTVLRPEVYALLESHAHEANQGVTNPYDVFRGQDLECWVIGYMYTHTS